MNKMNLNNKKKMNKINLKNKKKINKMMNKKMNKKKMKKKKYHLEFIVMDLFHQMNLLQIIWVKILNLYFKRKEIKLCLKQRSC